MHIQHLAAATLAVLTAPCFAQDFIGFSYNAAVGATSRGSLGNAAGEVMTRIDGDEVAGWGTQTPGTRSISALYFVIQDQLAQPVANTIDVKIYPESTTTPGTPDLAAGVTFATGITGPTGTNTIAAVAKTISLATPVSVPIQGGGDVFVSFVLPAVTATSNLSVQIVLGYAPTTAFLVYDTPNLSQGGSPPPAAAPGNTHFCTVTAASTTVVHNTRRMHFLDVAHADAAGRALGITNQTSYTVSNNPPPAGYGPAPGTGDFLSGSFPDISGANAGRVDDIAFDYYKTGLGTGALVLFMLDISPTFGPEIPVSVFAPGSGVLCVNLASAQTLGIAFTTANEAFLVSPIPAVARPSLAGLPFKQQAAGLDPVTSFVYASPCNGQIF